jgi:hypothetical protein
MRGTVKDEKRWALVLELLKLNPSVTYARIGREVGYKGQNVGIIARSMGLPPRIAGGFQKKDETPLIYPPETVPKPSQEASGEPTETTHEVGEKVEADGT